MDIDDKYVENNINQHVNSDSVKESKVNRFISDSKSKKVENDIMDKINAFNILECYNVDRQDRENEIEKEYKGS